MPFYELDKQLHPDFANPRKKPVDLVEVSEDYQPLYYWDTRNPVNSFDIAGGPGDSNALSDGTTPTLSLDQVGPKLTFNGSTQRLLTGTLLHGIGTGDYTIITHVRTGASINQYAGLVSNGDFSPGLLYARLNHGAWGSYFGAEKTANTTLSTNTEYVLGVSRIGSTLYFYLNGVSDGSATGAGASWTNAQVRIGSSSVSAGNHFTGDIYSVGVCRGSLSAGEHRDIADNRGIWALQPAIPQSIFIPAAGGGVTLAVADSLHSHSADNVALTQKNTLAVQESGHAHTADNLDLTQKNTLAIDESSHAHGADNVALTQANTLVVAESLHAHTADAVVLSVGGSLVVQEAIHAHTADNVALTQANTLTVQEALHSIGSDNITLSTSVNLTVFDSTHAHSSESVVLTQANVLVVQEALHALSSDNLALVTDVTLIVSDTLHAHIADSINLIDGDLVTPDSRIFVVPFENRVYIVAGE